MKARLASILNTALFCAAVPFVLLAVGLLYVAYLLAGNPRRSTFNRWVSDTLFVG